MNTEHPDNGTPSSAFRISLPIVGAFAVVPLLLSIAMAAFREPLPPLTVTADRPALLFATYLYHHGDEPVPLEPTLESEFRFLNESDRPVEITSVERSCGCMSPRVTPRIVEPGGIGTLRVPLATVNQSPGPHEYTLNVHYNDGKDRQTTLSIKAVFPEKMVTVTPPALYLSQKSDSSFPLPPLKVSDYRDDPLMVVDLFSTAPFIDVNITRKSSGGIQKVSHQETAGVATTLLEGEVAGGIPPGRHHALITASTNDDQFPVVVVPMVVRGPEYPVGRKPIVNPEQFRLHASLHPSAIRTARLEVMVPADWKISVAHAWPESLIVSYREGAKISDTEKLIYVDIELQGLPPANVKDGVVQLIANDGRNLITAKANFVWP